MTRADTPPSSLDGLPLDGPTQEVRVKRLKFRSGHRGTKELDILFGAFAARHLDGLSGAELDAFERLLDLPDPEVYDWIAGAAEPPAGPVGSLVARIRAFRFRPEV